MNHRWHTILTASTAVVFGAVLLGMVGGGEILGQPPAPLATPKVEGPIQYVGPDTYILLDAQGRPQPMLGMTYEEFVAAWKKLEHVEADVSAPRYTIDELRISGDTHDEHAELDVEITVKSVAGGTLKVPLGMTNAILLERPKLVATDATANGETSNSFVDYQPQSGGFVAYIAGEPNEVCKLKLKVLCPLARDGSEVSLQLNLPRALVSHLSLSVKTTIGDATTTTGALVSKSVVSSGGTRLEVDGPTGDFRLAWSTAATESPELATVLSANGAIAIAIDGHSIRSDARLTVRSYGGSFDRFRVRLPPGAKLIQDRPRDSQAGAPDFRIVAGGRSPPDSDGSQIITVELAEKQLGPVEVVLSTEQPLGLPTAERAVELAGFEVLGAVRQFGDVAIQVADDWQLRWENGPYVRQVERTDLPASLRELQPKVAFQYDRQPWSLRARFIARPMVIHVAPDYQLKLGTADAQLRVRLAYQVPGARAFEFHVQLAGWELTPDPIESNGLVDRDGVLVTHEGVLVLPLVQASPRRAEISFGLRRSLDRDATVLMLPLPVPEADTVAAADLAVVADTAVELLPDMSQSRGISPTPVTDDAPPLPIAEADLDKQVLRYRSFVPDAMFATKRTIRPSEVTAEIDTALVVDGGQLRATQDVTYQVEYQPLDELTFELPDDWSVEDGKIEILPTPPDSDPIVVPAITEPTTHGRPTRIVRAALAQPRLGKFRLHVAYDIAQPTGMLGLGPHLLTLPQPTAARVTGERVRVTPAANFAVSLDESAKSGWHPSLDLRDSASLLVSAVDQVADLPLLVEPASQEKSNAPTVERVWLQTWQAGGTIQDRAAIKFRSAGSAVTVELPPLSVAQEVEVLADGKLARVSTRQEGRLIVELPVALGKSNGASTTHTLEMRYRRLAPAGLVTRHQFTPPQLVGASALSEVYWQVVLPGDRHIIQAPSQLAPIDPQQWLEVFLGRQAVKTQGDLEEWVGATSQIGPTAAQNAYLFSGLAPMASIEMLTAPRWLIVLAVSGTVLALVSAWIYLPMVRQSWIVFLLAALVAALAIAYPAPAALLGQAAVLGAILAAIATALRHWTNSPAIAAPSPTGGSTNMRRRSSLRTDSYLSPSLGAPPSSQHSNSTSGAPTAPLSVPEIDR